MRVALIYTGHLRTWEKCKPDHFQKIITPESDLYFYTYEDPMMGRFVKIPGEYWSLEIGSHPYDKNRRPETSVANTFNQWHNNFIGFNLVPKVYDVYVRIRADITFSERVDFTKYDYSGLKVYIPHGHNYWGGVNDQVAFGNYEAMKKYYSVYLNHGEIFKAGVEFHTERYVTENLRREGVEVVRIPIDNFVVR